MYGAVKKIVYAQPFFLQKCGLKAGDFVVSVGDTDVKWCLHDDVVKMIKELGDYDLSLTVITPQDKNYLQLSPIPLNSDSQSKIPDTLSRRNSHKDKSFSMWTLRKKRSTPKERKK